MIYFDTFALQANSKYPAHHIRNRSSQTFEAVCALPSQNRWCLTGTPIHNSINDYGALMSFIGIPSLIEKSMFDFWITSPLKHEKPNSLERVQKLVKATCLRRTKRSVERSCKLPQKVQKTEEIQFQEADQEIYNYFKKKTAKIAKGIFTSNLKLSKHKQPEETNVLSLINFLRLICNHGELLLPAPALKAWRARDDRSVDWRMMQICRKRCHSCGVDMEETASVEPRDPGSPSESNICAECAISGNSAALGVEHISLDLPSQPDTGNSSHTPQPSHISFCPSAKVEALLRNLRMEQQEANCQDPRRRTKRYLFHLLLRLEILHD